MFDYLSFERFQQLYAQNQRTPIYRRIPADVITPIAAYRALAQAGQDSFLLESLENSQHARYSFIGFHPKVTLRAVGDKISISEERGENREYCGDAFKVFRELLACHQSVSLPELPHLVGGAFGYISYDCVRHFEKIPDRHAQESQLDICFGFYDTLIVFDHLRQIATVTHITEPNQDAREAYQRAVAIIDELIAKISHPPFRLFGQTPAEAAEQSPTCISVDIEDAIFVDMVKRAKEYIVAGDAFQIVLSRCFQRPCNAPPLDVYRALRMINPSPYMFYLELGKTAIVGASPERLVCVKNDVVETIPIAGTRPRCGDDSDIERERELLTDPKEMAEHMMLVDLARNDIGRVVVPGTVEVKDLTSIQRLSHVMHIYSRVNGKIAAEKDALDALEAVFPAGTLTGAPKIRAMEIIDELETSRRGLYGGAICYIDNRGEMDSCIAIRMAIIEDSVATVRAGAGIVYDSVPEKEAEETRNKAAAVLQAIEMAEGELTCC